VNTFGLNLKFPPIKSSAQPTSEEKPELCKVLEMPAPSAEPARDVTVSAEPAPNWLLKPGQGARIEVVDGRITLVFLAGCDNCGGSLAACDCGDAKKPTEWLMWNEGVGLDHEIMKRLEAAKAARIARRTEALSINTVSTKSFIYDPSYALVPSTIKSEKMWLVFELRWEPETKKFNKTPYNPISAKKENDPATGISFADAAATLTNWNSSVKKFVLGVYIEPPYTVVDIDGCRDPGTGIIAEWAMAVIRELDSYAEASPSGTGVHVIVTAQKPGQRCKKGIEIYSTGRPLTVTGVQIPGTPSSVNQRNVAPLYNRMVAGEFLQYYSKAGSTKASPVSSGSFARVPIEHDDSNIVTNEVTLLMTGDFTENAMPFVVSDGHNSMTFPSQSEAIGSLLFYLALKHEGDPEKMETDFLSSALYQGITKWNAPNGKWARLGEDEIKNAIALYERRRGVGSISIENHKEIAASVIASQTTPVSPMESASDADYDVDPESGAHIPRFDVRTVKGIYKRIVDVVTEGTTMPPQITYSMSKTIIGTLLAGRVSLRSIDDIQPTQYLAVIGKTGTGKGFAWRRLENIFKAKGVQNPLGKRLKVVNSADSAAGIRDLFFDDPEDAPMLIFIDEIRNLGNKASQKKNPEILDIIGELANSRSISQVKARRSQRRSGTRTKDDCDLSAIMCGPSGNAYMTALAGRMEEGFNDRVVPEFAIPPLKGRKPKIDVTVAALLHEEIRQLVDSYVGRELDILPEASVLLESFWNAQPEEIQRKVRYGAELELDAYLNAIGRGVMRVEVEDVQDAITNFSRRLAMRAAFLSIGVKDDTARYLAALKRLTAQIEAQIRPDLDPWEYARSKRDFLTDSNAYRNDEDHLFERAWNVFQPANLQPITRAIAGVNRTKFYPAPHF
jgi:hypothetical protein